MAKLLKIMRYNTEASLNVVRHERRLRYATTFRDASQIAVFYPLSKLANNTAVVVYVDQRDIYDINRRIIILKCRIIILNYYKPLFILTGV